MADRFEIPPEMRAFAEKSVDQAKQAFDGFISAAHRAVSTFEGHAESAHKGAIDVTGKAMTFAERNIASSFDFAQKLVRAKDVQDMFKLQADYFKDADAGLCRAGQGTRRKHHQGRQGRHHAAVVKVPQGTSWVVRALTMMRLLCDAIISIALHQICAICLSIERAVCVSCQITAQARWTNGTDR